MYARNQQINSLWICGINYKISQFFDYIFPGRVVTLLASTDSEEQVWGIAYEIDDTNENNQIWNNLDYREKNGYKRRTCTFYPANKDNKYFEVVMYIGDSGNEWYAGDANVKDIAKQIIPCKGISGGNLDYLCRLAESMRQIAPHVNDSHLFEVEKEALHLITNKTSEYSYLNINDYNDEVKKTCCTSEENL